MDWKAGFLSLRRAIHMNFIREGSPIREEALSLEDLCSLVKDVGGDYTRNNGFHSVSPKSQIMKTNPLPWYYNEDGNSVLDSQHNVVIRCSPDVGHFVVGAINKSHQAIWDIDIPDEDFYA